MRILLRLFTMTALAMALGFGGNASHAALQAVGPISGPHGFPLFYTDTQNLSLELCLDEGWCFFDPVDPNDAEQVALGVGGEVFWWMGDAVATTPSGRAVLVLGMEGTFGGSEAVVNGQQISFGRVRVRVDVPVAGNYTVIHPFGTLTFNNVTVADGINYTADIGGSNFLDVANGFRGALQSNIEPFLTWPNYASDPSLQAREPVLDGDGNPVLDGDGNPVTVMVAQYVGDLDIPHQVVGSPIVNTAHPSGFQNFFRVTGPTGVIAETDLFNVMGKVYDGKAALAHTYPAPPEPNLAAVGPINRLAPFIPGSVAEMVDDGTIAGYPWGYPTWYEDHTGLQLTICPGSNPMCISDPVNQNDPLQAQFNTGGETFWWAADAFIDDDSPSDDPTLVGSYPNGLDATLVLGVEGTFGGSEAIIDGQQISFGRTRIRIDTPVAGTYTVVYPYGVKVFPNVPAGRSTINYTADIGIADPRDPDFAFVGALFSEIGPNLLTWTTFDPTLQANDPRLIRQQQVINPDGSPLLADGAPVFTPVHYVGDPGTMHRVTGATFEYEGEPVNYFRIIGPNNIDVRTHLFAVQGKVYDPETFRVIPLATVPEAQNDTATTIGTTPVQIAVLANDSLNGQPIPAGATVALAPGTGPVNGSVQLAGNVFTYTANAGFTGTDSFGYTVTVNGETSNVATVTLTVQLAESLAVARAQLDLRKLRWDIRGTGNETAEGRTVTVRIGSTTGTAIGSATVSGGRWTLRTSSTTAPPAGTVQIFVTSDRGNAYGPFTVQVR